MTEINLSDLKNPTLQDNIASPSLLELLPLEFINELLPKIPSHQTPLWMYWREFVEKYLRTGKSEVTVKNVKDVLRPCSKSF